MFKYPVSSWKFKRSRTCGKIRILTNMISSFLLIVLFAVTVLFFAVMIVIIIILIFFIALCYNDLLLWSEVGSMQLIHVVWKKSQMMNKWEHRQNLLKTIWVNVITSHFLKFLLYYHLFSSKLYCPQLSFILYLLWVSSLILKLIVKLYAAVNLKDVLVYVLWLC